MTITEAVKTYLGTVVALTAKVSTRIYPENAPQTPTYPYIVYSKITRTEGEINTELGHYYQYFQFNIYARTYKETDDIAEILIASFLNKPGVSYSGIRIINGNLSEYRDLPFDLDNTIYSNSVTIKISYAKI